MRDLFIGHTAEDESVASDLATALRERQFNVIYENTVLHLGDSLPDDLRRFFANARCGILLLSRSFFSMLWPQWELEEIAAMEAQSADRQLMTVLHGMDEAEVAQYSPTLARRASASTAVGVAAVADAISSLVSLNGDYSEPQPAVPKTSPQQTLTLRSANMPLLADQLAAQFSEQEMRDICFELGLSYGSLAGETKTDKTHALLKDLHRRGEMGTLMQLLRQLRPTAAWL